MTGWPAVGLVAVLIVVGSYCVVALDKWLSLRDYERRMASRGRVGDTDKRPETSSVAGRPTRQ